MVIYKNCLQVEGEAVEIALESMGEPSEGWSTGTCYVLHVFVVAHGDIVESGTIPFLTGDLPALHGRPEAAVAVDYASRLFYHLVQAHPVLSTKMQQMPVAFGLKTKVGRQLDKGWMLAKVNKNNAHFLNLMGWDVVAQVTPGERIEGWVLGDRGDKLVIVLNETNAELTIGRDQLLEVNEPDGGDAVCITVGYFHGSDLIAAVDYYERDGGNAEPAHWDMAAASQLARELNASPCDISVRYFYQETIESVEAQYRSKQIQ